MRLAALRHAADAGQFGGKAAALSRGLARGLPVPEGFALDAELVEAIARGEQTSALDELAPLLGERVAVRSSGLDEDSAEASFAGQHKTLLNVGTGRELPRAIGEVWRSARDASALAYRRRLGLDVRSIRMAVLIQPMLAPEVAGVLFTRDPVSGADERVIEAAWGLGEVVVSGRITPDLFRVARGGALLEARIGDKDLALRCAPQGGTEERAIAPAVAARACLSELHLQALDALASRCEAAFEGARDLEWAFEHEQLFLLQCRSVTR